MDAAQQPVPVENDPLTWAEICERYPDQFVCLVDAVPIELRSPRIASALVVGHGHTRSAASAPIRNDLRYTEWTVMFTGKYKKPLRRPPVFVD
jgi:hypothetical protein